MKKILIVDDDTDICMLLSRFLTRNNYAAQSAYKGSDALALIKQEKFDLILCDFRLPDMDGIEMLTQARLFDPNLAFIIITGYSDVKTAVKAIKMGAGDYVTKPIQPEEILAMIKKATETGPSRNIAPETIKQDQFVSGVSNSDLALRKHIQLIAPTDMSVIIHGETGTGKEFVARSIHNLSKRANKPFIAIDCGALPHELAGSEFFGHEKGSFTGAIGTKAGNFELAEGGTLFLDEIGNLTYDIQIKLLRVLQEKVFRRIGGNKDYNTDVRIIVATNENLKSASEGGKFREDLFHRLNEFEIQVTPLRQRKDDIPVYAQHFIGMANKELEKNVVGFAPEVEKVFKQYPWYGNLRELKNVIKRSVLMAQGDRITLDCLPNDIAQYRETGPVSHSVLETVEMGSDLRSAAMVAEKDAILNALDQAKHNKTKAARLLNIDRKTLYNKLKSYNILVDEE